MKISKLFLAVVAALACGLFWCAGASAATNLDKALQSSSFRLFYADVNSDGQPDLLLRSNLTIVPVSVGDDTDESSVAVPIPPPLQSFLLLSGYGGNYSLVLSPGSDVLASPAWKASPAALSFGSMMGNSVVSMFVPAVAQGAPSFVVTISDAGQPQIQQQLSSSLIGLDLSAAGVAARLQDNNADKRADLVVTMNGRVAAFLYADANGILKKDDPASIDAVWRGMLTELDRANKDGAMAYFSASSKDAYGAMFAALGADMKSVSPTLSTLRLVYVSPEIAEAVLTRTFNGQTTNHFVTFVSTDHGWDIMEF